MIKEAIKKIKSGADLSEQEMIFVFEQIMSGSAQKEDVKAFLLSLKAKGENIDEIVAAAKVMREKMRKITVLEKSLLDSCGTGGAPKKDINISTVVALVLAACGVKVAKHGNRSFSGKCGSADILEELGVNVNMAPEKVAELIEKTGFGFIFAPAYHPAMKNVMDVRKELKTRTIFNILGPLCNPAGANMQILGVYDPEKTELMAGALKELGAKRAFVVHGLEGFDEISIKGKTKITELNKNGSINTFYATPADFGIEEGDVKEVDGGSRAQNAAIIKKVLNGEKGAPRDMILINAAAALKMIGKVKDFKQGVIVAARAIDSGAALAVLDKVRELSNS